MPSIEAAGLELAGRYGPFGPAAIKPYARTQRSLDGKSFLKTYVGIDPRGRRRREVEAVAVAASSGLSAPGVLATGDAEDRSWTLFRTLPGNSCTIGTTAEIEHYLTRVLALTDRLHRQVAELRPGPGWSASEHDEPVTHQCFLLKQLTMRCQQSPWWTTLQNALAPADALPTVYLHGDLKPDHLLVDGDRLHIVDWEASCRGPAVCDFADVVFHLVRDLIYAAVPPSDLPLGPICVLPINSAVLAWRFIQWLDRRRPTDIRLLTADDVRNFADADQPDKICGHLARTIAAMRHAGVPR